MSFKKENRQTQGRWGQREESERERQREKADGEWKIGRETEGGEGGERQWGAGRLSEKGWGRARDRERETER